MAMPLIKSFRSHNPRTNPTNTTRSKTFNNFQLTNVNFLQTDDDNVVETKLVDGVNSPTNKTETNEVFEIEYTT